MSSPNDDGDAKQGVSRSLFGRIGRLFNRDGQVPLLEPTETPASLTDTVRIAWRTEPLILKLGRIDLECHPDLTIDGDTPDGLREWIIRSASGPEENIPGFLRIGVGETVVLGRSSDFQASCFGYDRSVANQHVKIGNRKGDLKIQSLDWDRKTELSIMTPPIPICVARRERLLRLPTVLEHPILPFNDDEALDKLKQVNRIVSAEAYRELDDEGDPGGVLHIPDDIPVVMMGDVHARVENILRVLTEGSVLARLERGKVCLIFLGDLLHSEADGELEDMSSSIFVLDLFCMLKLRFPKQIFYIHGNHESFSDDVGKGGVLQGLVFRRHVKKLRGKPYLKEVQALFDNLAYVVCGNRFAACHGAPVRSQVDRKTLVNIRRYPGLQYEIVWNRLRQSNRPAGYGKGSVKRFRQTLDLPKHASFVVAHNPQSVDGTLWLNVGDIEGHHIVYSARTDRLAVMVFSGGNAWPLLLIPDPALAALNGQENKGSGDQEAAAPASPEAEAQS